MGQALPHSLTQDPKTKWYWCKNCDGGPWSSVQAASYDPCSKKG